MKVRSIDNLEDWNFGKGVGDYKSGNDAVAQLIRTRINSFIGDCFFDQTAGINWFGFLGSKDQTGLSLAVSSVILNTVNVIGINQVFINLNVNRQLSISYNVTTSFSVISDTVIVSI